jgi:hypothetical protein
MAWIARIAAAFMSLLSAAISAAPLASIRSSRVVVISVVIGRSGGLGS